MTTVTQEVNPITKRFHEAKAEGQKVLDHIYKKLKKDPKLKRAFQDWLASTKTGTCMLFSS